MQSTELTKEITDNSFKFCKWTMQSVLGGVDKMKFAFVQRYEPKSAARHKLIGTVNVNTSIFARQINLNVDNCWAVLKDVIQTIMEQEKGQYIYYKDPTNTTYKLMHIIEVAEKEFE